MHALAADGYLRLMRALTLNPGTSTFKVSLVQDGRALWAQSVEIAGSEGFAELERAFEEWGSLDAVGVRFMHGGERHSEPVVLDRVVLDELERAAELAAPRGDAALALAVARIALDEQPPVPVVAAFDTTFHASLPDEAATYPLPRAWNERHGLRRHGFHGLSHESAAHRAANLIGEPVGSLRMVICHLGSAASLCAVRGGHSVDTTTGFTPLDGLVMERRCGAVDPGLLLWLMRRGLDVGTLEDVLVRDSGLRGLTGTSGDVREVARAADDGDADCQLALEVYGHRLRREIGAMTASAGGLDVLVFTGGVGEHSAAVRSNACAGLAHLGVELDEQANRAEPSDVDVSTRDSRVRVLVVTAREDLAIARAVSAALG